LECGGDLETRGGDESISDYNTKETVVSVIRDQKARCFSRSTPSGAGPPFILWTEILEEARALALSDRVHATDSLIVTSRGDAARRSWDDRSESLAIWSVFNIGYSRKE
jgi:hypothetical protein